MDTDIRKVVVSNTVELLTSLNKAHLQRYFQHLL